MNSIRIGAAGALATATAVLILAGVPLLGLAGSVPAAQASTGSEDQTGQPESGATLTMSGRGTASAVPDRLGFTLTASAKRDSLEEALSAAGEAMSEAQRTLRDQGIAERDIATTGLEMHPEYDYPEDGPRVLTGYRVTQRARVGTDDLAGGGAAISAVVRSGSARVTVGDLRLEIGDPSTALSGAREDAVDQARTKAEQYAAAAGVELGPVLSIREVGQRMPDPVPVAAAESRDSGDVPISAGTRETAVSVRIVWSIGG